MDLWLLLFGIALLIVAFMALASRFDFFARVSLSLARATDRLSSYLHRQFGHIPQARADASVIGLIVLGVTLFAISAYLPIYSHVLGETFKLAEEVAGSLALMLVCATGLAGILIHLSVEFGDGDRASLLSKILASLCICVTPLLWFFQAAVYHHFYSLQLGPQEAFLPYAMAVAAFFVSFIETLAFYWATRLSLGLIAWICVHLLLAPIKALAWLADVAGRSRLREGNQRTSESNL